MESFWIVRGQDIKAHGDYRTKAAILAAFDRMAAAMAGGGAFQTVLAPPPGDPSLTHLARGQDKTVGSQWKLWEIAKGSPPSSPFLVEMSDAEAPDKISGLWRCTPLREDDPWPTDGELVLMQHPALTRGGALVGIGAGALHCMDIMDATTGEPAVYIRLKGPMPPFELRVSKANFETLRPIGTVEKINPEG